METGITERVHFKTASKTTRVYSVDSTRSTLLKSVYGKFYLLDTPAGRKIACHPHIVADKLSEYCLELAIELKKTLTELELVTGKTGILHILRGSVGYMLDRVFPGLPIVNVRTQYTEDGYRSHSDDSRKILITYNDYNPLDIDTLIIPDTYATGRSVETALQNLLDQGLGIKRVILYGFIAAPGIKQIHDLLCNRDIELLAFAICNITQLCVNKYDMPLYGLDEPLYMDTGEQKQLGSIVAIDTLRDMADCYIPGMDQPGDWSERHKNLYNGYEEENGNIRGHLEKSLQIIESLDKINKTQPWYNMQIKQSTVNEIEKIRETLTKYR